MVSSMAEFKQEMTAFHRVCQDNLSRGKKLFDALDHGDYKELVHQPVLLKIIFERYLELMESRLIPALEKNAGMQEAPPQREEAPPRRRGFADAPDFAFAESASQGLQDTPGPSHDDHKPGDTAGSPQETANPVQALDSPGTHVENDTTGRFRRAVPRYKRRLPLQYQILGRDQHPHRAYSRDIGAMGLFIMSNRPEKTGDHLRIDIEVPGAGMTQLEATVVWTKYVPHNLRSMDYSGFGVRIAKATESWYNFFVGQEEAL